jgi:F-type H+-transporting ATPase subunit a
MEHLPSWFDLLPWEERLSAVVGRITNVFKGLLGMEQDGKSFVEHQTPAVEHVYAAVLTLFLIVIAAVVAETSIRNAKEDLLPHGRLTIRNFVELLVGAAYGMMSDIMGPKAARYFLPLIGTCAFFILFSNVIGLIPGFAPATDNFNTTLACGLVIFFTTHIYGLKENGWNHVKHFFGPIWWLAPLMVIIETISHLVRPLSLGIRLMANMMADHMVLTIFLGLLPAAYFMRLWIPIPLPMYLLGSIVVLVQTLVFCLLSTIYIAMAIEHAEHH